MIVGRAFRWNQNKIFDKKNFRQVQRSYKAIQKIQLILTFLKHSFRLAHLSKEATLDKKRKKLKRKLKYHTLQNICIKTYSIYKTLRYILLYSFDLQERQRRQWNSEDSLVY